MPIHFTDGDATKMLDGIAKAMAAFPAMPKTAQGQTGHQKFKYTPYRKVVQCIKPSLAENGIGWTQSLHTENGNAALTLLVFGHGAAMRSTLEFPRNPDIKVFGAEVTYNKRYQLTSFFGLEGDPDADDFEDDVVETKTATKPEVITEKKSETAIVGNGTVVQDSKPSNQTNGKQETKTVTDPVSVQPKEPKRTVQKDTRSIGEKLTDAMKQLNWSMVDFDSFCRDNENHFPGFTSASKLPAEQKLKLHSLLIEKSMISPF